MSQMTRQRRQRESAPPPAKVEDNTLDEQHAGISERTFPVTDNDQSAESGQSHVGNAPRRDRDRERRIAVAAYLRAERRGFAPGAELEDWLDAEKEVDSQS
jgi:hypothetical protein